MSELDLVVSEAMSLDLDGDNVKLWQNFEIKTVGTDWKVKQGNTGDRMKHFSNSNQGTQDFSLKET